MQKSKKTNGNKTNALFIEAQKRKKNFSLFNDFYPKKRTQSVKVFNPPKASFHMRRLRRCVTKNGFSPPPPTRKTVFRSKKCRHLLTWLYECSSIDTVR